MFVFISSQLQGQNKSANTWIIGAEGMFAKFAGDTSKPVTGQMFDMSSPNYPYLFVNSQSNICDSATGQLLFMCNGMRIYDTTGLIMENGDSLQPPLIYNQGTYPLQINTQGSLILPKGSNGLYYVFVPTITDSAYTIYMGVNTKVPYDLLQYHVINMNANGGMGKVIQKNVALLSHVEMNKVGMMACRHANGYDWWLLKQALDTNLVYTFLVTADTVELKLVQGFASPKFGYYNLAGQSCFSTDGSKYAFASGGVNSNGDKLFLADFDRCTGVLSNPKYLHAPLHNSNTILDSLYPGEKDTMITGLSFSQNDSFLYVSKSFNIYQYELSEPDSTLAWFHVQHGPDTTFLQFVEYGQLQRGVEDRIYIGKWGGAGRLQNSVIDNPNIKGVACSFCRKCLRYDAGINYTSSPPNMPDFNLGKKEPCWPLTTNEIKVKRIEISVYPNPANTRLYIKTTSKEKIELFNSVGQLQLSTLKNEIDMSRFSKGLYYIKIENVVKKVIVE